MTAPLSSREETNQGATSKPPPPPPPPPPLPPLSVTVLLDRHPTHAKPAKLADLLCWRHLEGRTHRCVALDASDSGSWASVDVGVGNGSAAKAAAAAGGSSAVLAAAASAAADLLKSDRALSVATFCSGKRGATLAATRAALERAGVPLRADVGPREAAEGSVCLCLHPALELRLPLSSSSSSSSVERALRQLEREGRAEGVPLDEAAEVCRRALDAACELEQSKNKSTAASSDWPPELAPPPVDDEEEDDDDNGDDDQRPQRQRRRRRRRPGLLPQGWCDRLHLGGVTPWCPAHVRWLLRLAPGPCYCGGVLGGHGSMDELLARAEEALVERWRQQRRQRQRQQQPDAVLAFEWSPSLPTPPTPPEHACLFVSGLDERVPAARVRAAILAALAPVVEAAEAAAAAATTQPIDSQPLVRVVTSKGSNGRTRGWARVTVPAELAENALAALSAPNKRQNRWRASRSLGRADALFPLLPPEGRLRLRLDPVATFSVMDQPLAEKVADLLAALAEGTAAAAEAAPPPRHAVDACACAGGSALALSRRFARVTAIELDPDRAEDLAHNFVAAARWQRPPSSSSSWWVELRQPEAQEEEDEDVQDDAPSVWPTVPAERRAVVACADSLRLLLRPETLSRKGGPLPPGFGGVADEAPQPPPLDVVFFDPPWGGPQYRDEEELDLGDDDKDADDAPKATTTKKKKRDCHAPVATESDVRFAGRWLSRTAAELLASSRCRLVAVRLPARTVDARAFARKVAEGAPGAEALLAVWGRSAVVAVGRASAAALAPAAASPLLSEALKRHGCAPLSLHD